MLAINAAVQNALSFLITFMLEIVVLVYSIPEHGNHDLVALDHVPNALDSNIGRL